MLVARASSTTNPVWGRHRTHIVVLAQAARGTSLINWVEFTETGNRRFAGVIRDLRHPSHYLTERDALPESFASEYVLRLDEVFHTVKNGPSLWPILNGSKADEVKMIKHGYWTAQIRNTLLAARRQ